VKAGPALALGLVAGLAGGVALGAWGAGGARLITTLPSPDGRQRVELYAPTRWQGLGMSADLPAVARLVRVADSAPLGESAPFEASGEVRPIWSATEVQIGTTAVADRRTGRWTLTQ
jgi:hypothetical protein